MNNETFDIPSVESIRSFLKEGRSYVESIDQTEKTTFSKYKKFKVINMSSDNDKTINSDRIMPKDPSKINKDNFRWFNKDRATPLSEMDGDYLLTAITHSIRLANKNWIEHEKFKQKVDHFYGKTNYFMRLAELMEEEFVSRYDVELPEKPEQIRAMRDLIKCGTLKLTKNKETYFRDNDANQNN